MRMLCFWMAGVMVMEATAGDWLVDPTPFEAHIGEEAGMLVLDNGLVRRELRLSPDVATWSYRNLLSGEEYVRGPSPEATLTVDGVAAEAGGLDGVPVLNYIDPRWQVTAHSRHYRFTHWTENAIRPRFEWRRRPEWSARELPWPPKGREATLFFEPLAENLPALEVHYEIYDGAPIVAKWIEAVNTSTLPLRIDRYESEILRLVEAYGEFDEEGPSQDDNLIAISDMRFCGARSGHPSEAGVRRTTDPGYVTQENFELARRNRLVASPESGPWVRVGPGERFESHRVWEISVEAGDRERRGLAIRRFWRLVAPWTDENPMIFHLRNSDPTAVRSGIEQCAESGFETLLMSFESGFDHESTDPAYRAVYRTLAEEAAAKGVAIGGYSLMSSRSSGVAGEDVVGACKFGVAPCLASGWGADYIAKLEDFMSEAGFGIFENDGPYPGDVCAATHHAGHEGVEDSVWAQWRAQCGLFRFCRSRGIYVNQPDVYFLDGGSKTGMGYREDNWSLPREQQVVIERQNIYDGTWTKTSSMGWMFVPLCQYHGGGEAAVLEPLKDHLDHYECRLAELFSAGVQACWRGPRLYDSPETLALVRKWTDFYRAHRRVLTGDLIHLRRPDGRDWDGWLMCDAQNADGEKAMAALFNPTDAEIVREIRLPLHYAGLEDRVEKVAIPANGHLFIFF